MTIGYRKLIAILIFNSCLGCTVVQEQTSYSPALATAKISPYTQVALRPDFSHQFKLISKNLLDNDESSISPIEEIQFLPRIGANILIYPYYAYLDYQRGYLPEPQFWLTIKNVKPAVIPLSDQVNQDYNIITKYTIGFYPSGIRYMKPWNLGETPSKINILFSNLDLQLSLNKSLEQVFNESSPAAVFKQIKHYATLLQRSTVLDNNARNFPRLQKVNDVDFSFGWLSDNTAIDPQILQTKYFAMPNNK